MRSIAILFTTALALASSTSAYPAQVTVTTTTVVTVQPTDAATATQSSTEPNPTQSNGNIPGQGGFGGMGDSISDNCQNAIRGIVVTAEGQQSCLPVMQLAPIWNQTLYDSTNIAQYISQGLDVLCQAPECSADTLSAASQQLKSNCNSKDENSLLVKTVSGLVNNYGAARKLGCEKLPNDNNSDGSTEGNNENGDDTNNNSDANTAYCVADATQFYLNKGLLILTGKWKENPEQLCPPCANTWYSDIKELEPQYEDLKEWKLAEQLEEVCPYLKNSTSTSTTTGSPSAESPTQATETTEPTPAESQTGNADSPAATPTPQPSDGDQSSTVVIVTTTQ
ncbi:hypothetical protein K493DRAFT_313255 [Basidiobolus meristosporus CBS 931.73]|uniref:Uncharacterized protein n=1 Tax=Basidiobolus meristosporus CBS 931.73 TaxID=1314790 RepID=A0A1Y1YNH6_9FUNG|nr:hypothetical protein K493DRAFT_313255 [Basidiobolus meristosporus CBS 931.73]|eukprot:ORX99383.1 hypothetical protein K493DRAFT_313255 [Basidiobolus meristosporus CBS 931.73]